MTDETKKIQAPAAHENGKTDASKPNSASLTDILHLEKWIDEMVGHNASDMHIVVGNVPIIRVEGKIAPMGEEDIITPEMVERIVEHVLSDAEVKKLKEAHEIMVSRTLKKVMRFRIHIFYSRGYPTISMRHIQQNEKSLGELGLPKLVTDFANAEQGIVILTGPLASGKTTTASAMVQHINHTKSRYIVVLESPVEHIIPSDKSVVVQREVGSDVASYKEGLDALMSEDVNVIMVGSLMSEGVMERALALANSGRLVIVTTHNRDVMGVLTQLRDTLPPQDRARIFNVLADSLLGIFGQLLLPKIGGGRVLIPEILIVTQPIKSLLRENKIDQIANVMQTSAQEGMMTFDRSLAAAVKLGKISVKDAQKHASDPYQFNSYVSR